jgi:hypothetical protein
MEAYTSTTPACPSPPHIERVVGREVDGDRFLEPALGDRLSVHRQRALAAFAGAAAVVGEVASFDHSVPDTQDFLIPGSEDPCQVALVTLEVTAEVHAGGHAHIGMP